MTVSSILMLDVGYSADRIFVTGTSASGGSAGERKASSSAREAKTADRPEAMCSTRPCHIRCGPTGVLAKLHDERPVYGQS